MNTELAQVEPSARRIILAIILIAALGGMLYGYDTGIISSALLSISDDFQLTDFGKEAVTSAILVGGIVGAFVSGPISDRIGRKRTILLVALLFCAGGVLTSIVTDTLSMILARFFLGLAVGAITQIMPVYIAELSPAAIRGGSVVLFQVMIAVGQLLSYVIGYLIAGHWRIMFLLAIIPGLALFIGMLRLPESPRWLVSGGNKQAALKILQRVRGNDTLAQQELDTISEVNHNEQGSWRDLRTPWVRPALVAAVGIAILCQLTGINAVIYYAPTILRDAGFTTNASLLATIGVGVVLTVVTLLGSWLVDKIGRRKLMVLFIPVSIVALVVLGACFVGGNPEGSEKWIAVAAMLAYIAFNGGSLSVIIWLINSEVIPLFVRGKGTGLASVSLWTADLLVTLSTLSLISTFGAAATFWGYAVISLFAFVFVLLCVPETKGRTLEEIEASLRNGTFRPTQRGG
ncbi:sugar porter family MFS transporter [Carnimonas bestiolae]|uniref:sugar porter family MFS transporter n=1 Tax=Carnimonas bestiolae TaxID=3402172 RepID=UPI003EDBFB81